MTKTQNKQGIRRWPNLVLGAVCLSVLFHAAFLLWPLKAEIVVNPSMTSSYSVSLKYTESGAQEKKQIQNHVAAVNTSATQKQKEKISPKPISPKPIAEPIEKTANPKISQTKTGDTQSSEAKSREIKKRELKSNETRVSKHKPLPTKNESTISKQIVKSETNTQSPVYAKILEKQVSVKDEIDDDLKSVQESASEEIEQVSNFASKLDSGVDSKIDSKLDANNKKEKSDTKSESQVAENQSDSSSPPVKPASYQIGSASNPKPYYPPLARKRGWEGDVVLGVNVAADGSVESLLIIKGAPYGALTHAAWETVKEEWSFEAAMQEGRAIASYVEVPISFRLTN